MCPLPSPTIHEHELQKTRFAGTVREEAPVLHRPQVILGRTGSTTELGETTPSLTQERGLRDTEPADPEPKEPIREPLDWGRLIREDIMRPSPAFAEFTIRRNVAAMTGLLDMLKANLDKPEGAAIMVSFRQKLADAWKIKDSLPKERVLLLSAVDEVVRDKKWRELTPNQVEVLNRILHDVGDPTLTPKRMTAAFRLIHKSDVDIYPSSTVAEDEDGED